MTYMKIKMAPVSASTLMHGEYEQLVPDYEAYARRKLPVEIKPARAQAKE